MAGILGGLVVLSFLLGFGDASSVKIESERGSALVLPLEGLQKRTVVVNRRLEYEAQWDDARMTLHDDLLTKGYYTSRVFIGTPPEEFALIVDTGRTEQLYFEKIK